MNNGQLSSVQEPPSPHGLLAFLTNEARKKQLNLQYARIRLQQAERNLSRAIVRKEHIESKLAKALNSHDVLLKLQGSEYEYQLRVLELDTAIELFEKFEEELFENRDQQTNILQILSGQDEEDEKQTFDLVVKQINKGIKAKKNAI